MLDTVRRLLGYRVSVGQLIVVALLLGTPYLIVGTIWSSIHTDHLTRMSGTDLIVSFLGSIASWPALLVADVCMT